jgi:cell division septum initiation protein DivIVA
MDGPKGFTGLDIIAVELDRQYQIHADLLQQNQELQQRIAELENIIKSNNVPEVIM